MPASTIGLPLYVPPWKTVSSASSSMSSRRAPKAAAPGVPPPIALPQVVMSASTP